MTTLSPIPYTTEEPIPVGEVKPLMPFEQAEADALFEAACTGLCWRQGVAGMDDQGQFCDAGRAA